MASQREKGSGLRSGREGGAMTMGGAGEGRKPERGEPSLWEFSEDEV